MSQQNRFSELPAELRLEIHELALSDFTFDYPVKSVREPGLLQASRLLRNEALPIYTKKLKAVMKDRAIAVVKCSGLAVAASEGMLGRTVRTEYAQAALRETQWTINAMILSRALVAKKMARLEKKASEA